MRPAGETAKTLLQVLSAACAVDAEGGGGMTLRELAAASQVGLDAATQTIKNLNRRGRVCVLKTRRVPGRNRPVAVYALPVAQPAANDAVLGLSLAMRAWG